MNEFVEECRTEWKRLGVPEAVANEMAADLAADLEEAEAEGASAEEVLGSGAFDPRSFATAWAAERGLIRRSPPSRFGRRRRSQLAAAIAILALILAIIGAALVITASPSAPAKVALASAVDRPAAVWVARPDARPPRPLRFTVDPPYPRVVTPLPAPVARVVAVDTSDSGVDSRTVGSVLLIVGLAGIVPSTLLFLWLAAGRGGPKDAPVPNTAR